MSESVIFLYCEVCQERTPHNAYDECLRCIEDVHKEVEEIDTPPWHEHPDDCDCEDCDMGYDDFYDDYDEA